MTNTTTAVEPVKLSSFTAEQLLGVDLAQVGRLTEHLDREVEAPLTQEREALVAALMVALQGTGHGRALATAHALDVVLNGVEAGTAALFALSFDLGVQFSQAGVSPQEGVSHDSK